MANDIQFLFKAKDIQMLIEKGAVYIKPVSKLVSKKIDNQSVAVMVVTAQGINANNRSVGTIEGCPCPPCTMADIDEY